MSKEYLEALGKNIRYKKEYVGNDTYRLYIKKNEMEFLEKSLQRLEAIDNANPSEALKCLERINKEYLTIESEDFDNCFNTIKQTLLKAQEQEKENLILKEIIKSLFDSSIMHLGEFEGVDLDEKLKEILHNE